MLKKEFRRQYVKITYIITYKNLNDKFKLLLLLLKRLNSFNKKFFFRCHPIFLYRKILKIDEFFGRN